ncbi:hypothetical protein I7I53_10626 [Histoplasma capsulatum var. duboisii H88]|uniref:Uncharacterized protein n=1 Tax=Ajellomyces capsulatus (strain H88) TaxID=544711 RepID=A0A8A1L7H3_AJEC8|nr:hypothetical protein I7I53_10626 [Histoplasma capsulatum var. duboisii H88]
MLEHSVSVNVQINSKSAVSSIGFRGLSISSGASNFGIIRTQQKTSRVWHSGAEPTACLM